MHSWDWSGYFAKASRQPDGAKSVKATLGSGCTAILPVTVKSLAKNLAMQEFCGLFSLALCVPQHWRIRKNALADKHFCFNFCFMAELYLTKRAICDKLICMMKYHIVDTLYSGI